MTELQIKHRAASVRLFVTKRIKNTISIFRGEPLGQVGLVITGLFALLGIFAPYLAPYEPDVTQRGANGEVLRVAGPSLEHPMGTTQFGYDIFSQWILASRVSLIVGATAAVIAVFIGTNIGLISAYYGGKVDSAFMRVTDIAYALPFLPFTILFLSVVQASLLTIIIAISVIMWRGTARVIRSQVLSHKERPYVESAEAIGAGDLRIMYVHILPNVLPLAFLYTAFSVAWAIILEASLSFLGFGDAGSLSWGRMVFQAFNADVIYYAWWWVIPPGAAVMLLVMSVFFITRALEKQVHPSLRHRE